MTLSILQLNAVFNNKGVLTLCEYCGCIYVGDLCECRRIAAINSHYGDDQVERLYQRAIMVEHPHRTPRRAVDWFGESYDVSSFAPSSIEEELVEETGEEEVSHAISNRRNPCTF
jgi:hypothetical protein